MPYVAPNYDYSPLIGRRITLDPSGEDMNLDRCLPRRATITRQIALRDWGPDWLVVEFDEPFDCERGRAEYGLIRARWFGHPIGSDFCPVFIMFDHGHALSKQANWSSADFTPFSWAEARLEQSSNQLPDPTSPAVTPPAGAGGAPSVAADH